MTSRQEQEKRNAALRAVDEIEHDMLVGLGTGTTATYAIVEIGRRVRDEGLRITASASSEATHALAHSLGITIRPMELCERLDLSIDGADEVDGSLRLIKGGGGALFREKVIAAAASRSITIVDSSKSVRALGRQPLPIEVHPFALAFVKRRLEGLGSPAQLRLDAAGNPYQTDQNANIYDIYLDHISDPEGLAVLLDEIPGVLAHGLFIGLTDSLIVGLGGGVELQGQWTTSG